MRQPKRGRFSLTKSYWTEKNTHQIIVSRDNFKGFFPPPPPPLPSHDTDFNAKLPEGGVGESEAGVS